MVMSTGQLRSEYGPACHENAARGAQDAWDAHQEVMAHHGYKLRAGDTGSRSCRPITGGKGYSLHAYFLLHVLIRLWNLAKAIDAAVAGDFNWDTNPYGPRLVTDMPRAMVDAICAIRTHSGAQVFRWGGYYAGNKDAMHYEIVCSHADLASGIDWSTVEGHNPQPTPPEEPDVDPHQNDLLINAQRDQNGISDWGPEGGDLNSFEILDDGRLMQLVAEGNTKDWRKLADHCVPGTLKGPRYAADGRRIDLNARVTNDKPNARIWLTFDADSNTWHHDVSAPPAP